MSKKTVIVFGVAFLVMIGSIVSGLMLKTKPIKLTPEVGDVWEHSRTGDPFDEENLVTREVLDVKGDYVKYVESNQDTLSMTIKAFLYHSDRISSK